MDGNTPHEPAADAGDPHTLKALTAFGDKRRVIAALPIYSANGIKLLDTGAKIDSRVFERLFNHRLATPLEQSVTSDDAIRHSDLIERTRALIAAQPLLAHFVSSLGPAQRLWTAFGACPLPRSVALRLTVVRDAAPALYDHSLRATFVALFIGLGARFAARDLQVLATAALLHDIGMQHVDPALFQEGHQLTTEAQRQLHAHPLLGQLIAQREPELNSAIATAIAQHHERLDGSGYPRGLHGESIHRLARVLMLVEVILAIAEHGGEQPELQLSTILRLNHRSFDQALTNVVLGALPSLHIPAGATLYDSSELDHVCLLFDAWTQLRAGAHPAADNDAAAFIDERIARLKRWMIEAGVDPAAPPQAAADDAQAGAELCALGREAVWHTRQIARDAVQRWPALAPPSDAAAPGASDAASQWIVNALRVIEQAS